jgi:hypothetical protein
MNRPSSSTVNISYSLLQLFSTVFESGGSFSFRLGRQGEEMDSIMAAFSVGVVIVSSRLGF